ncbi:hypothetical protein S7711_09594 [Stachybotrys chartarum IBT 7711]|uniref:FAD-binding domain-containing protein n=1 Tax=Stachybotrys chartarum (strain CBS 109288 / IBT 7711) TaxID=1280523 RepID=A0A084B6H6_STACB|nr:hypothetical protein S7711_09594 [Stachybotrys chartarum IBT 7711]
MQHCWNVTGRGPQTWLALVSLLLVPAQEEWLSTNLAIHWGKRLVRIDQGEDEITAHFGDGTTAKGDILIGADGINSVVREYLLQKPNSNLLTLVPLAWIIGQLELSSEDFKRQLELAHSGYMSRSQEMGFHYFAGVHQGNPDGNSGKHYWQWMKPDADIESPDHWLQAATQQEKLDHVLKEIAILPDRLCEIFDKTPVGGIKKEPHIWRDLQLEVRSLPSGRVILRGDAARAMTPFRGEGGHHALINSLQLSKLSGGLGQDNTIKHNSAVKSLVDKYNDQMLKRQESRDMEVGKDAAQEANPRKRARGRRRAGQSNILENATETHPVFLRVCAASADLTNGPKTITSGFRSPPCWSKRRTQHWIDPEVSLAFLGNVRILAEVAAALQALHAAGIAHGDAKPGNVLLFQKEVSRQGVRAKTYVAKLHLPDADFAAIMQTDVWSFGIVSALIICNSRRGIFTSADHPGASIATIVSSVCQVFEISTAEPAVLVDARSMLEDRQVVDPDLRRLHFVIERLEYYHSNNNDTSYQNFKHPSGYIKDYLVQELKAIAGLEDDARLPMVLWELGVVHLSRYAHPDSSAMQGLEYIRPSASRFGQTEVVLALLHHGTDASLTNSLGENTLHCAWCFDCPQGQRSAADADVGSEPAAPLGARVRAQLQHHIPLMSARTGLYARNDMA